MEWKPIETAPLGVPCLVHRKGYDKGIAIMHVCLNAAGDKVCQDSDYTYDINVYGFTHWMPLPDAPRGQ